ncbi:hypothetical protein [Pimelobacter simplex]|uniref:hypothetical protein n=1 Tax=Nocardioides simplex TaxID=2045 RepID=UPI001931E674|nr:hypothetical protein [Pimelobacter simplex]
MRIRAEAARSSVTAGLALADEWQAIDDRWDEHLPRTALHRAHATRLRAVLAASTTTTQTPAGAHAPADTP